MTRHTYPLTPERDSLRIKLAAAIGGPDPDWTDAIVEELSDVSLAQLVTLVEAPALVEQRVRARIMLEHGGSFGGGVTR